MNDKYRKNLNTFEDTNLSNNIVKYPKIPAVIAHTLKDYGSAESLIKHIFFYLVKQYQSLAPDTFLGQNCIDISPETIGNKLGLSNAYLLTKTIKSNPPYLSRHAYDLAFSRKQSLPLELSDWSEKHKKLYDEIEHSTELFCDTVLTDALYRMWQQKIEINGTIDRSVASVWKKTYSKTGFSMLEQIEITKEKVSGGTKISSIRIYLTDALISQIHEFYTLIEPKEYEQLLKDSKGHKKTNDLYTNLSNKRTLFFLNTQEPKRATQAYKISFAELCDIAGIKYRKEPQDKDNWRYKEARKSLLSKLEKLVQRNRLWRFEIERVRPGKQLIDVYLWFVPLSDREKEILATFYSQRKNIAIQRRMSTAYRERLKPGIHPWDANVTDEAEIIKKYCNQEYYYQWLGNVSLDISRKYEAIKVALTEVFPGKPQQDWIIKSEIKKLSEVAKQSLSDHKIGLIELKDAEETKTEVKDLFAWGYKFYLDVDYIFSQKDKLMIDSDEFPPMDLKTLYVFFSTKKFKNNGNKDLPTYVKYINAIRIKTRTIWDSNDYHGKKFYKFAVTYLAHLTHTDKEFNEIINVLSYSNRDILFIDGKSPSWNVDGKSCGTYYLNIDSLFIPLEDIDDNTKKFFQIFSKRIGFNIRIRVDKIMYDISPNKVVPLTL